MGFQVRMIDAHMRIEVLYTLVDDSWLTIGETFEVFEELALMKTIRLRSWQTIQCNNNNLH